MCFMNCNNKRWKTSIYKTVVMVMTVMIVMISCGTPSQHASGKLTLGTNEKSEEPFIILLSVPGFSFQELQADRLDIMPTLKALIKQGGVAALNVRTPERGIEDVYASINAGAPTLVPVDIQALQTVNHSHHLTSTDMDTNFLIDERETASYRRFTGNEQPGVQVVVPKVEYLKALNESQTYHAQIGRLGQQLVENGVDIRVFGNRNNYQDIAQHAPLIVMTQEGVVARGDVSNRILIDDDMAPQGVRTNTSLITSAIKQWLDEKPSSQPQPQSQVQFQSQVQTQTQSQSQSESQTQSQAHAQTQTQTQAQAQAQPQPQLQSQPHAQTQVQTQTATSPSKLVVIEYGDWYRLDQERSNYEKSQFEKAQIRELAKLDEFVQELVSAMRQREYAQMWIFSPQSHSEAYRNKLHVTPFIRYEFHAAYAPQVRSGQSMQEYFTKSGMNSGLLTSATTRRAGLISIHDIGPSLLHTLGIQVAQDWTGKPMQLEAHRNALNWLLQDVEKMQHVYELRTNIVIPFVMYEVVVLLASLVMVLLGWRKGLRWMKIPLFSLLAAPLFILLLGSIASSESLVQMTVLILLVLGASACLVLFSSSTGALLIAVITALALLIDGLNDGKLLKYSVMGYDPMIGARYYGIGNEFMGVLVGSAVLAISLLAERLAAHRRMQQHPTGRTDEGSTSSGSLPSRKFRSKRNVFLTRHWPLAVVAGLWFLFIILYIAAPRGGTNAGGALTASAAFGITWILIFGRKTLQHIRLTRLILIVTGLLSCGLLLLWITNQWLLASDPSGKSHIGRAMDLLTSGRIDIIAGMIVRKLQMNLHLIGVSSWGKVLLAGILVLAVLLFRPRGLLKEWQLTRPYWMSGFMAILTGAIVALALNDSGIVAAGTMIVYAAVPILLLLIEEDRVSRAKLAK